MSFAVWRQHPEIGASFDPQAYLRFDYLVEADVPAGDPYAKRRADAVLEPSFVSVWLDQGLDVLRDADLEQLLGIRTPHTARDTTLRAGDAWQAALASFPGDWPEWCREGAAVALQEVRQDPSLALRIERAVETVDEELASAESILTARALRLGREYSRAEFEGIERVRTLVSGLRQAIESPSIRPMFAGVIFLSRNPLPTVQRLDQAP